MNDGCAIRVEQLRHRFGTFDALRGVSFQVEKGAVFGLIGPNGAGKTTLIRIMATLLEPTSGSVEVNGTDIAGDPDRARRLIGYMSDQAGVYERLSVREYLEFFAEVSRVESSRVVPAALELTDLDRLQDRLVATMSKGMKQRLQVARVLLADPDILLLDEPASDLDPRARIEMRELLMGLQSMGKTILLSSHILSEMSDLCTAVAILDRGTVVASGPIDEILATLRSAPEAWDVDLTRQRHSKLKVRVLDDPERAKGVLMESPLVREVERHPRGHWVVTYEGEEREAAAIARTLIEAGVDLVSFEAERSDLERMFLEVTKGELQ